ncbi:hypothetical protein SynMEDNS5_01244 [Synechococcus sp. MEDNS5]|uniref:hypothetical protein n=1 Tax=Synechococcus sp. MEDNS5 TaxID=1442554 RepID=UPI001648D04B|nr:hypothetical protein [Synechococcus sp. MEDNS5]QNJ05968.1 hypothetical protein SynMEDNS5_01244 [Synechococcus sp. MEDNS5]
MSQTVPQTSPADPEEKAPASSVSRRPLWVLLIPVGLLVATFFDRPSSITNLSVQVPRADQPVESEPFELPNINDRVTVRSRFSVPAKTFAKTFVFLSTELLDDKGVVQFQYDREGKSRSKNDGYLEFRPKKPGRFRLRFEVYLPRDQQAQPTQLTAPVVVNSVITKDPFDSGVLVYGFFASLIVSFLYLSQVYFRGSLQCSGWCGSQSEVSRATRGEYKSGLLRVRFFATFEHSGRWYANDCQAVSLEITNGLGRSIFQGTIPSRLTRDGEDSDTYTLRAEPQLFHLTRDSFLRFDVSLPSSLADIGPERLAIQICDEVTLPWTQAQTIRARLNP